MELCLLHNCLCILLVSSYRSNEGFDSIFQYKYMFLQKKYIYISVNKYRVFSRLYVYKLVVKLCFCLQRSITVRISMCIMYNFCL